MRPVWLAGLALAAWAAAAGMSMSGCFNPAKPACAFSCAEPPHTCPSGYLCGDDQLCHDPTSTKICGIVVFGDAATDATDATDAGDARADAGDARADAGVRDSASSQ